MKNSIICLIFLFTPYNEANVFETAKLNTATHTGKNINIVVETQDRIQKIKYLEINDENILELEEGNLNITTEDYHSENSYKYVIKYNNFSVIMLYAYYDLGNYDSYLVTIDSLNNEISKKIVYFNSAPDGNIENYEYSDFRLSENLDLEIFNVKIKVDLENDIILKRDSTISKFHINSKGELLKKE